VMKLTGDIAAHQLAGFLMARAQRHLLLSAALTLAAAAPAAGQSSVTLSGQVVAASSEIPIEGATVELNSIRQLLTNAEGQFRFTAVPAGPIHLHIEMIGYQPLQIELVLTADTTVLVKLEGAPIRLEGIDVEARTFDIRGRAVDPRSRLGVAATVVAHPGRRKDETNITGRYKISDVPATDQTAVSIYSFGYVPQTRRVEGDRDAVVDFAMTRDSVAAGVVERMGQRLAARSDALGKRVRRGTHDEFNQAGTILDVLRYQYQVYSVRCFVWDDDPNHRPWVVPLPHEVELIEIIGQTGTAVEMVRIYTKEYFSRNFGFSKPLPEILIPPRSSRTSCR